MHIVIADDGLPFTGASLRAGPLGGAESAVVDLAEALAARGHRVIAGTRTDQPVDLAGVDWRRLSSIPTDSVDLLVANRGCRLLAAVPRPGRRLFWVHNPARYLLKARNLARLAWYRPDMMFAGPHHAATYPGWAPGGRRMLVPLGVSGAFRAPRPAGVPAPRAIFASNPLRGLDWLVGLWDRSILPRVPGAELHVYGGARTYGGGGRHAAEMAAALERAAAVPGVIVHGPVDKAALAEVHADMRVMLYGGDPGETFCLAVAEALACGVPAVVRPRGAVAERVVDGVTGFVTADDVAFADRAVAVLRDDALWLRLSVAASDTRRDLSWDRVAADVEAICGSST